MTEDDLLELRRNTTEILCLQGWGSTPEGLKPTFLRGRGHEVVAPDLPHDDFDESVRRAQAASEQRGPGVVVGSIRGGAVALNLDEVVPVEDSRELLKKRSGLFESALILMGRNHRLADPESLEVLLQAVERAAGG